MTVGVEFEPSTLGMQGTELATEPPRPTIYLAPALREALPDSQVNWLSVVTHKGHWTDLPLYKNDVFVLNATLVMRQFARSLAEIENVYLVHFIGN